MTSRNLTTILVVMSVLILGGCALAPGMTMYTPSLMPSVKITSITPQLIARLSNEQAAAAAEQVSVLPQPPGRYEYRVGPRDILNITVWDHPELTIPAGEFRSAEAAGHLVAEDGTIFFPYAGKVQVAGKTLGEVRELLTRKIAGRIVDPQLDVRVAAYRSQQIYVAGEVAKPGPQPVTDVPLTIVQAINQAGDVTPEADMATVTLTRGGTVYHVDLLAMYKFGDVSGNQLLRDGDILYVPDRARQKVFVLGEVARPSSLLIHKGELSLAEAIADAGGVNNTTANPARIYVIRGKTKQPEVYHLDGKSPDALMLGDQFKLRPRDVVYVDTAGISRWNRVIEQILPTAQLLNQTAATDFPLFQGRGIR